jgi:hypothetical protein
MSRFIFLLALISNCITVQAQVDTPKSYTTTFSKEPLEIDGILDKFAWTEVEWAGGDFRQLNPDKGKPSSVQTKFKILYDAKNLYVAILALDPEQ